jgi:hypothetical protein
MSGLIVVAVSLFVLFGTQLAAVFLSPAIFNPAWQISFASTLLNAAPLALIGLAIHRVACIGDPDDERLFYQHKRFAHLAFVASLAFLLLIPLQVQAILRQNASLQSAQSARIQDAERRLSAMRLAVASASGNDSLNSRLQDLNGPVLSPSDLAQPLPRLKAQVSVVLDQAALQIRRERDSNPSHPSLALLPELLRFAITSLALAVGFAALGRRPGSDRAPLLELQEALERRRRRRSMHATTPL